MLTYKNNGGDHTLADGTVVKKGKTFVSDDMDLLEKFPNKFSKVDAATPVEKKANEDRPTEPAKVAIPATQTDKATNEAEKLPDCPEDVTADFPKAVEIGLVIHKVDAGYAVFDGAEEPANEAPLKNKAEVNKFIKEYIG